MQTFRAADPHAPRAGRAVEAPSRRLLADRRRDRQLVSGSSRTPIVGVKAAGTRRSCRRTRRASVGARHMAQERFPRVRALSSARKASSVFACIAKEPITNTNPANVRHVFVPPRSRRDGHGRHSSRANAGPPAAPWSSSSICAISRTRGSHTVERKEQNHGQLPTPADPAPKPFRSTRPSASRACAANDQQARFFTR